MIPEIGKQALQILLEAGNPFLIDVRELQEIEQGMIDGALHIPLGQLTSAFLLSDQDFLETYGRDKPSKQIDIVCYCRSGVRSANATDYLLQLGYQAVSLEGGYSSWKSQNP